MLHSSKCPNVTHGGLRKVECLYEVMVSRDTEKNRFLHIQARMYKNLSDIKIDETGWVGERPYSRGVHVPEPEARN